MFNTLIVYLISGNNGKSSFSISRCCFFSLKTHLAYRNSLIRQIDDKRHKCNEDAEALESIYGILLRAAAIERYGMKGRGSKPK